MLLDTTVKPLQGDEYDLDFVCELICGTVFFQTPGAALDLVERALRASGIYGPMVERKNRCIRLNYAKKFHIDILPACRDPRRGGTCILVPDHQLGGWTASNPKGFGVWFNDSCRKTVVGTMMDKAAPIPIQQPADRKPPLKLCVQLWKRWRDIHYKASPESAPISIVLTTIAGALYRGDQSISGALGSILDGTATLVKTSRDRIVVSNPKNPDEDLSEKWGTEPAKYRSFVEGVHEFDVQLKALVQLRGLDKIARALERLFGEEIAKRSIENQTRDIEASRARSELGVTKLSGILTASVGKSVQSVPLNTFYGEET
jgi:hypothetical protein